MPWITIVALAMTFSFGSIALSYHKESVARGWPCGAMFSRQHPLLIVPAAGAFGFPLVLVFFVAPWWSFFIVGIVGIVFANLLLAILRVWVQPVALAGVYFGLAACIAIAYRAIMGL